MESELDQENSKSRMIPLRMGSIGDLGISNILQKIEYGITNQDDENQIFILRT